MKALFLDDSYLREQKFTGLGGFCLDARSIRALSDDFCELKRSYGIPQSVEIKWSPPPDHYLRKKFRGSRFMLYADVLSLLHKHKGTVLCAVHGLKYCYGVRIHSWKYERARRWAVAEQIKFLAERFQKTYLEPEDKYGLIVSDSYASREGEESIINTCMCQIQTGTFFQKLIRIALTPLMTDSKYCIPIQIADVIIGITVSYLCKGKYGIQLIDQLAPIFAFNPHLNANHFTSTYNASVLGIGLKLFPAQEMKRECQEVLKALDTRYEINSEKGIHIRQTLKPNKGIQVKAVGPRS